MADVVVPAEPVVEPVRNTAATTTGASIAVLLSWIYNDVLAARYGIPRMPEPVVIILAMLIIDLARLWLTRPKVVIEESVKVKRRKPHVVVEPEKEVIVGPLNNP